MKYFRDINFPKNVLKIAVFGGAFNPIHLGHLRLANNIIEIYGFNRIVFVPSGDNYSKENLAPENLRYKMIEISVNSNSNYDICNFELGEGIFVTSDLTVKHIQRQTFKRSQLFFLCGSDCLDKIVNWPTFKELIKFAHILICERTGFKIETSFYQNPLYNKYSEKFILLDRDYVAPLSSKNIRNRIKKGLPVQNLVTKEVVDFIKLNKLYLN